MESFVLHLSGPGWAENTPAEALCHCWMQGQTYLDDEPITVAMLASHIALATSPQSLTAQLQRLNGFYAWVSRTEGQVRAGVDHIRSRPLFYGQAQGYLYLADNAEWVRQQLNDTEMDTIAREEFQLAGYVTGPDTLFPNVKQLQAGECLIATATVQGLTIETQRYYRFLHTEPAAYDEPMLRAALDRAVVRSIQRLIDYAGGRQIVVPLSGGYDSRLIVTVLKRLAYENVLTFTYGVPGNKESEYSKSVATALGLRWHFVEYSEALWREAGQTPERWEIQHWASGWACIANLQDWLAVRELNDQALVEPNCLFVPGHSGDFVAGSHIPSTAFEKANFNLHDAIEAVFTRHYNLAPLQYFHFGIDAWEERITTRMEREGLSSAWDYADAFEKWDWQERQAKFICNSVRVYEFYGYDWWMPWWDVEFMRFWEGVPLELRKKRMWYVSYVKAQYAAMAEDAHDLENATDPTRIKNHFYQLSVFFALKRINTLRKLVRIVRKITTGSSALAWEGLFEKENLNKCKKRGIPWDGIEARETLINADKFLGKESCLI